jgi:hypothetical protein
MAVCDFHGLIQVCDRAGHSQDPADRAGTERQSGDRLTQKGVTCVRDPAHPPERAAVQLRVQHSLPGQLPLSCTGDARFHVRG